MSISSKNSEWFPVLLGFIVLFISGAILLSQYRTGVQPHAPGMQGTSTSTVMRNAPQPPSEAVRLLLEKDASFQYLISYTTRGFEPSALTARTGTVVRFTNNSATDLLLSFAPSGAVVTCTMQSPGACVPLHPKEFVEISLPTVGMWAYVNALKRADAGSVHVTP